MVPGEPEPEVVPLLVQVVLVQPLKVMERERVGEEVPPAQKVRRCSDLARESLIDAIAGSHSDSSVNLGSGDVTAHGAERVTRTW